MNDFKSFYENGKKTAGTGDVGRAGVNGGNCNGSNGNGGNINGAGGGVSGNGAGNGGNGSGADYKQTADMAAMLARAFGGKSEAQVWKTILAQAEEGKRNGTLTNKEIDDFYATVAPMLDGFKRRKLKEIVEKLKAI